jgi:hypothetical protein
VVLATVATTAELRSELRLRTTCFLGPSGSVLVRDRERLKGSTPYILWCRGLVSLHTRFCVCVGGGRARPAMIRRSVRRIVFRDRPTGFSCGRGVRNERGKGGAQRGGGAQRQGGGAQRGEGVRNECVAGPSERENTSSRLVHRTRCEVLSLPTERRGARKQPATATRHYPRARRLSSASHVCWLESRPAEESRAGHRLRVWTRLRRDRRVFWSMHAISCAISMTNVRSRAVRGPRAPSTLVCGVGIYVSSYGA